ncbi:hypothetical protein ACH3XW_50515 [Acanthocheilonema viteae]
MRALRNDLVIVAPIQPLMSSSQYLPIIQHILPPAHICCSTFPSSTDHPRRFENASIVFGCYSRRSMEGCIAARPPTAPHHITSKGEACWQWLEMVEDKHGV